MANVGSLIPALLLVLFMGAVLGGTTITVLVLSWKRKQLLALDQSMNRGFKDLSASIAPALVKRPQSWLAVRSKNVHAVQLALGLNNAQPCTWLEGLSGDEKLFIAPAVKGWVLIVGSALPDPADDVDICFRFLTGLSQKLGHVQFFQASRALGHHAWVRVENGKVSRAYAWAGRTLWNQGTPSRVESDLGLKCFQYFESDTTFEQTDTIMNNVEKVSALAGRWSLDPATIDEHLFEHAYGIAGEPPRLY